MILRILNNKQTIICHSSLQRILKLRSQTKCAHHISCNCFPLNSHRLLFPLSVIYPHIPSLLMSFLAMTRPCCKAITFIMDSLFVWVRYQFYY